MIFRVCVGSSLTELVIADIRMLNPVQLLMAWSSSGFIIRVSNHLKFLTWHTGPVCLGSLHITLWYWSDDSGLDSHAIVPGAMCPLHWSSPPSGLYCPMLA